MTEYVDESLTEAILRRRSLYNDNDHTVTTQERCDEIPENIMSSIDSFRGDGLAKITVSGALSSSHEYHKADAFVSVQLTCNNDLNDVKQVHDIVRPFVQGLVAQDHYDMSVLRDDLLPPEKKLHSPTNTPSIAGPPSKVTSPPPKGSGIKIKTGAPPKPSLRR